MTNVKLDDETAADFFDDVIGDFGDPASWSITDLTR